MFSRYSCLFLDTEKERHPPTHRGEVERVSFFLRRVFSGEVFQPTPAFPLPVTSPVSAAGGVKAAEKHFSLLPPAFAQSAERSRTLSFTAKTLAEAQAEVASSPEASLLKKIGDAFAGTVAEGADPARPLWILLHARRRPEKKASWTALADCGRGGSRVRGEAVAASSEDGKEGGQLRCREDASPFPDFESPKKVKSPLSLLPTLNSDGCSAAASLDVDAKKKKANDDGAPLSTRHALFLQQWRFNLASLCEARELPVWLVERLAALSPEALMAADAPTATAEGLPAAAFPKSRPKQSPRRVLLVESAAASSLRLTVAQMARRYAFLLEPEEEDSAQEPGSASAEEERAWRHVALHSQQLAAFRWPLHLLQQRQAARALEAKLAEALARQKVGPCCAGGRQKASAGLVSEGQDAVAFSVQVRASRNCLCDKSGKHCLRRLRRSATSKCSSGKPTSCLAFCGGCWRRRRKWRDSSARECTNSAVKSWGERTSLRSAPERTAALSGYTAFNFSSRRRFFSNNNGF